MNQGILFTALSGILYGSIGYFGVRLLEAGLGVSDLLFWRFLFSLILLLPLLPMLLAKKLSSKDWQALGLLFFLGAIFYGVGTALYFEASKSIGTGLAMVIFFTYPIFVASLSLLIHKIPLGRATLTSLLLILIGCTLIAFGDGLQIDLDLWGIFLALLSGGGYGCYLFLSKQISHAISPILATFTVCLGATFAFIFFALATQQPLYWPQTASIWLLIALFSLLGTVLPIFLMLVGLKYISASKASIISVLEPVTVLAVGALILNEAITTWQLLGAAVILTSAIIVQLDKEKAA